MFLWIVLLLVVLALAYVRLAPTDVGQVHRAVEGAEDKDGKGHCLRVIEASPGALGRIDAVMRGLARTAVVAGSVEEGRITYVTRSRAIGFPDFTTVEEVDGQIRLFARLRFGRSDFGVNRARLTHVLKAASAA